MRKVNTFSFFTLGKILAPIYNIDEKSAFGAVVVTLFRARGEVTTLLNSNVVPIRTCRQAANELVSAITAFVPTDIEEAMKADQKRELGWWNAHQIKEAAKKFETVLAEELNIIDTYAVSQKGAYSTSELIANAEVIFPENIRKKLPIQTVNDIREAGRCLAFETPTASAFHIVRAIESVILAYYTKVLGKPAPTRMRNWGVYIKQMRDSGKGDPKVIDFLEHIKDHYRNPVSHPDAVLSVDDVIVLLGAATSAITQMAVKL